MTATSANKPPHLRRSMNSDCQRRRSTRRRLLAAVLCACAAAAPRAGRAQSEESPPAPAPPTSASTGADTSASTSTSTNEDTSTSTTPQPKRVRPDSLLRQADPPREIVDLRSTAEKQRDLEVAKHYARLAELDVMAQMARRSENDRSLVDRIDDLIRRERQRFRAKMRRMALAAAQREAAVAP